MTGTIGKFDRDVGPLSDDSISEVEQYRSALRTLHSQAVVDAQSNFVPNRVLGATSPELSSCECYLSRSIHTTPAQLHSGHCWLLNSYKACITAGVIDVCLDCGVAPHSIEHLFQCPACPTQLTQGSYRSGKTGKCQEICVVREMSGKMLFLKSQGKWSSIMETADNWFFASPNIKKQANLRLPLNVQKVDMFQLQEGFAPLTSRLQGLCCLHIALLIPFQIPIMTIVW